MGVGAEPVETTEACGGKQVCPASQLSAVLPSDSGRCSWSCDPERGGRGTFLRMKTLLTFCPGVLRLGSQLLGICEEDRVFL